MLHFRSVPFGIFHKMIRFSRMFQEKRIGNGTRDHEQKLYAMFITLKVTLAKPCTMLIVMRLDKKR